MPAIQTSGCDPSKDSCPCPCGHAYAASCLNWTAPKGRENGLPLVVGLAVVAVPPRPLHRARGRVQEVWHHQNRHRSVRGPRRCCERVNEEQQGDDEVNHQRWTAGEMTGDEKLGPKRLGDQWLWTPWREHGSAYVSLVAGRP